MVYESLIAIVESHLEDLTKTWVQEVKKSEYLSTYQKLSDDEIFSRGRVLFSNLQSWLMKGASNYDAAIYFKRIGEERINEGMPLTEVFYALHLEKKVLWSFVAWKDEISGILKAVDAIEFMTVINNYFDLGNFYIIKGYNEQLFSKLTETKKFTEMELQQFLVSGALYQESIKKVKEKMYSEALSIGIIR
ncbi:MAG: hypothetical protein IPH62_10615 [Ignavibacteriae bacterium]|nr:hypothetical protein [Ignavibacteriota bacterium]